SSDLFKQSYTGTHSFTVRSYMGIGSAYLKLNEPKKARQYLVSGFQQLKKIHVPISLEYALSETHLGIYMLSQKNYQKAESLFQHAMQTLKTIEGEHSLRQQELQKLLNQTHKK